MPVFYVNYDEVIFPTTDPIDYEGMRGIAEDTIYRHFTDEQNPNGAWPSLAESTLRQKTTSKMLYESGEYIKSWKGEVRQSGVFLKSSSRLSVYHEEGTIHMPARSVAWFDDGMLEGLSNYVGESVVRAIQVGRPGSTPFISRLLTQVKGIINT